MPASNDNSSSGADKQTTGAEAPLARALLVAKVVRDPYLRGGALCYVAEGYIKLGDRKRATKVLSEALRAAGDVKDHEEKAQRLLDISCKCCRARDLEKALRAAKRISEPVCLFYALRRIAGAWAEEGDYDKALATAESIKSPGEKAVALSAIVAASAAAGQKDRTRELLLTLFSTCKEEHGSNDRDRSLADVAHNLAEARLFRHALRAVRRIRRGYWRGYATARIADAYAEAGKREKCLAKLSEAVEIAPSIPQTFLRVELLTLIAGAYQDFKEREAAVTLLEKCFASARRIRDRIDRSMALSTIAFACVGAGDYEQALKVVNAIDYGYGQDMQLALVAGGFAEGGIFDKALQVAGRIPDRRALGMAFAAIAAGFARRGHFDQALWTAQSIKDPEGKAFALRNVANVYLESGLYIDALQTVAKIGLRHVQSHALVDIAVDCAESGRTPSPDETRILEVIANQHT